eukprot:Skav227371  [mRNA]  locus=scaffold2373:153413:154228:+ [translate_table: standard]
MFHLISHFSGESFATLNTEEVNGRSTKSLKTHVFSITGISRFRQRLFLEDGSEISTEEELSLPPQNIQTVLLQFQTPDAVRERRLIEACMNSDVQSLEECLEEPQDPNWHFEFSDQYKGFSPIHLVAWQGCRPCLHLLFESGADMNKATIDGATPLFVAAESGVMEVVRFLVEAGGDVNKAMNNGAHPLGMAAMNGHMEVVGFLVESGADINKANDSGSTALFAAAQSGQIEIVRFLVESGADVNKAMKDGTTPLFFSSFEWPHASGLLPG